MVADGHVMEPTTIVIADDHAVFREGTRRLLDEEPDLTVVGDDDRGRLRIMTVCDHDALSIQHWHCGGLHNRCPWPFGLVRSTALPPRDTERHIPSADVRER